MSEFGDVVSLRDVRMAITMDGVAFSATVNANTRPTFATGSYGGASEFGPVVKLEDEPLLGFDSDANEFFPGGGNWFVDTDVNAAISVAEGEHSVVQYGAVVRLLNQPLETATTWTGDAFSLNTPVGLSMQFAEGRFGNFASDPFDVGVAASLALTFDEAVWTAAAYTEGDFAADMNAPETGTVLVLLLTLTHPDWDEPVRISTDPTNRITATTTDVVYGTTSRGDAYYFLPLQITLPSQTEEGPLRMRVVLDNVNRDLVAILRALSSPPSVDVDLVSTTAPNAVLASWPQFLLVNVDYSAETISGELVLETLFHEPFPAGTFTPSEFVGLF